MVGHFWLTILTSASGMLATWAHQATNDQT